MDLDPAAELRALRWRAYGPEADIHTDEAAVRRLLELEGRADAAVVAADEANVESGADQPPQVLAPDAATPPAPMPMPMSVPAPERGAWRRWRTPALWVASLITVLVATVVASNAVIQGVHANPQSIEAAQVASLRPDSGWDVPEFFAFGGDLDDARGFEEFYGLRVVVIAGDSGLPMYDECMWVMTSVDAGASTVNSFDGPMFQGCAAGSFAPVVTFSVTSEFPEQLRQAFPDGAAVQFMLESIQLRPAHDQQ